MAAKKLMKILKKKRLQTFRKRRNAIIASDTTNNYVRTIAILSAEKTQQEDLEKRLRSGYFAWFPVKGKNVISCIVYNTSLEDTLYMSRETSQKSFIFMGENYYGYWKQNEVGKLRKIHERDLDQQLDKQNVRDLYMRICLILWPFPVPFFDASNENQETMAKHIRYVNQVIENRVKDTREADSRIKTTISAGSGYNRWCNRGILYGKNFYWE